MKSAAFSVKLLLPFLAFLALAFAKPSYAVTITAEPLDDSNNPVSKLDENAARAKVTFSGLPDNNYWVCLGWADMSGGDCADSGVNHFRHDLGAVTGGSKSIIVCATSVDGLPGGLAETLPGLKMDNCNSGDYFHAHNYRIKLEPSGGTDITWENGVSVDRFVPTTAFSNPAPKPTDDLSLTMKGVRRPFDSFNNNYSFKFIRDDGLLTPPHLDNVVIPAGGTSPPVHIGTLQNGDYTLTIELVARRNPLYDQKWIAVHNIVEVFHIKVADAGGSINGSGGGSLSGVGANPCENGTCQTALGDISTSIKSLTASIMNIAFGLAGGLALILMVIGSIRVLASSGDQQRLNGGREMIIAAAAGLLFLIFAVLILRFIGFQIFSGVPGIS